jgi:mono/diheme cytochrome c family protein
MDSVMNLSKRNFSLLVLMLLVFVFFGFLVGEDNQSIEDGKKSYLKYCSTCHGTEGKGDGAAAIYLFPKPRDFTSSIFKFQSTPVGSLPTDEDLLRTIAKGMPGSAMPAWDRLSVQDRNDLVAYIKSLSPRFATEKPSDVVVIDREPQPSEEMIRIGKVVYALAGCGMCHGKTGAGDGPSSESMTDDLGRPIKPYNFTRARAFKGGGAPRDIYRTFSTGVGGTPMPGYGEDALTVGREAVSDLSGFEEQYSREELQEFEAYISRWPTEEQLNKMSSAERTMLADERRWALVYYVLSLSGSSKTSVTYTTTDHPVLSVRVGDVAQFNDPQLTQWDNVKGVELALISLWQRDTPTDRVFLKSVTDGNIVVFRMEWEDPTKDDEALYNARFGDAAAVQFPLDPASDPFFGMGDTNFVVNIWQWKSWWEQDITQFAGVHNAFPNTMVDFYPFDVSGGSRVEYFVSADSAKKISLSWNAGWGSANLLSAQTRASSVEDLNARGFGTLTSQPLSQQNVFGKGIWKDGRWVVVMMRRLTSEDHHDVQLKMGQTIPVSFAVWDGSLGDRNGQKMVTNWYQLTLGTK